MQNFENQNCFPAETEGKPERPRKSTVGKSLHNFCQNLCKSVQKNFRATNQKTLVGTVGGKIQRFAPKKYSSYFGGPLLENLQATGCKIISHQISLQEISKIWNSLRISFKNAHKISFRR